MKVVTVAVNGDYRNGDATSIYFGFVRTRSRFKSENRRLSGVLVE